MDTTPLPPTTVKEALDILDAKMTNEKAIRIFERPLIPMNLVDSATSMDTYLTQLREDSIQHEKYRLRSAKAVESRRRNLEQKARQITIEPSTEPGTVQQQKSWRCKEVDTEKRKVVLCKQEVIEDSSVVVERRVGYKVTCPWCSYQWVWHGKKDRFFISCSRCHKSFKLNWK
jgi:hypothetical protein